MCVPAMSNSLRRMMTIACTAIMTMATDQAWPAAPCAFEQQGEGHVSAVIDGRSFRLTDGREIRLAGIELALPEKQTQALAALLGGRDVRLSGDDDTPDRYGRELAFVWLVPNDILVQRELLAQGA